MRNRARELPDIFNRRAFAMNCRRLNALFKMRLGCQHQQSVSEFPAVGQDCPSAAERRTDASCIQRVSALKTEHLNLNLDYDLLRCCSGSICLQTSRKLEREEPSGPTCSAHDDLRATSWGHPSSPVLGPRKQPTPPLPLRCASDSLMVTPPPDTFMLLA